MIDWSDGDDPQYGALLPLSEGEALDLQKRETYVEWVKWAIYGKY